MRQTVLAHVNTFHYIKTFIKLFYLPFNFIKNIIISMVLYLPAKKSRKEEDNDLSPIQKPGTNC